MLIILFCLFFTLSYAEESNETHLEKEEAKGPTKEEAKDANKDKERSPPPVGNFVLPASQQPYALFGFGGNVIDKDEVQLFFFADYFQGNRKVVSDMLPSVLFGVTDDISLLFSFPFTPELRDRCQKSSGLQDFFIQAEYGFYSKKTPFYVDEATLVFNVTAPTGSIRRAPPTGAGSATFFLGWTYCRMMTDWFLFTAQGAILSTADHRTKIGDQFLYQFGLGRNIPSPRDWIYAWIIEFDGQYSKKNRIRGRADSNSGGNVIYATPSLFISSKELLIQFGVSAPLTQSWFGKQRHIDYALNLNLGWSFY